MLLIGSGCPRLPPHIARDNIFDSHLTLPETTSLTRLELQFGSSKLNLVQERSRSRPSEWEQQLTLIKTHSSTFPLHPPDLARGFASSKVHAYCWHSASAFPEAARAARAARAAEQTPASGGRSTFLPQSPTHTSLRVIGQDCHVVLPAAPEGVKGGIGFSNRGRTARDCRVGPAAPGPLLVATPALPSHHPLSSRPLVDSESATSSPPRPPGDPDPGAVPSPPQAPASPGCSEASGRLPRGLMLGQQALLPRGPSLAVSLKSPVPLFSFRMRREKRVPNAIWTVVESHSHVPSIQAVPPGPGLHDPEPPVSTLFRSHLPFLLHLTAWKVNHAPRKWNLQRCISCTLGHPCIPSISGFSIISCWVL
ncbi:uncharacterized protein LOC123383063 [Felis catus]|uniref:uncharacterized protein LOC123383063 n=1 Tax=Felis catus TaxID=9685 RepID=UPI001D19D3AC|nr:uncharacterized protein LOC123383063 [Felis catus]